VCVPRCTIPEDLSKVTRQAERILQNCDISTSIPLSNYIIEEATP
jgi:hypothetical protein